MIWKTAGGWPRRRFYRNSMENNFRYMIMWSGILFGVLNRIHKKVTLNIAGFAGMVFDKYEQPTLCSSSCINEESQKIRKGRE
jgi:hypothetical protein